MGAKRMVVKVLETEFSAHSAGADLPDIPVITIEAGRRWLGTDLRELWAHRDLFYFLVLRDIKVRYKQTALGVSWAVLQPFLTMVVFTVFFGKLARIPSDGVPYSIFAYAGLLPWTYFSNAVSNSSNSLVGSASLITKVYFPRVIVPAAAVGAALADFLIAFAIMFAMMAYYRVMPGASIAMLLPLTAICTLLATGVGMWTSALNVKYRDIRYALPFFIQLWMFVTPVIYPTSFVPDRWRWLLLLNPLTGLIEGFRSALFARPFDWTALVISTVITIALAIYATYSFARMERGFADIV
jgi:lipopolysaccharide transport system permease protein